MRRASYKLGALPIVRALSGRRVNTSFPIVSAVQALMCIMLMFGSGCVSAQDLTPRVFWPAPHGTKFFITGLAYATGNIITDPVLPLEGVNSRTTTAVIGYRQTTNLAGRTANVQIEIPYVDGHSTGAYEGVPVDREIRGLGDIAATLDVNLMGAPSMTAAEFLAFRQSPNPILAASIKVVAPTGEYEPDKRVNAGGNRWATKLKLGYLHPMPGKWVVEMAAGVWFFEDNDEFLGKTREQKPLGAFDFSVVKRFRPGFWGSIDANYYVGGRTIIDGGERADLQRNSRLGVSLGYPIKEGHAVKLSVQSGVLTESGGEFDSVVLNYLYRID